MEVKYIDSDRLLPLIKVESIYVIARSNMDYFCRYVTVDQDDTSAKKSASIFEKLTFLGTRQSSLKLSPYEHKKRFNASICLQTLHHTELIS